MFFSEKIRGYLKQYHPKTWEAIGGSRKCLWVELETTILTQAHIQHHWVLKALYGADFSFKACAWSFSRARNPPQVSWRRWRFSRVVWLCDWKQSPVKGTALGTWRNRVLKATRARQDAEKGRGAAIFVMPDRHDDSLRSQQSSWFDVIWLVWLSKHCGRWINHHSCWSAQWLINWCSLVGSWGDPIGLAGAVHALQPWRTIVSTPKGTSTKNNDDMWACPSRHHFPKPFLKVICLETSPGFWTILFRLAGADHRGSKVLLVFHGWLPNGIAEYWPLIDQQQQPIV